MEKLNLAPELQEIVNAVLDKLDNETYVVDAQGSWCVISTPKVTIDIELTK